MSARKHLETAQALLAANADPTNTMFDTLNDDIRSMLGAACEHFRREIFAEEDAKPVAQRWREDTFEYRYWYGVSE